MKQAISFVGQHGLLISIIVALGCILLGRIWSNSINWGVITDPKLIIKKNKFYKVINFYLPKDWTEDWIEGSIVCLRCYHRRFFFKYSNEIYVAGDGLRFTDDGPTVGTVYQAVFPHTANGLITLKKVKLPL